MAYKEVSRVDVTEVVRRWQMGDSQRQTSIRNRAVERYGPQVYSGSEGTWRKPGRARTQ